MGILSGRTREATLVCLLFVLLTLVLAAPLSLSPATHALPLSADTRLFLWTISWDVHALLRHPLSLFDANIFFPEHRTLAYSEHILGSAVLGAPALLATGNPVLALNVIVLLSCVLSGLGAWFLARELGASVTGAILAGVIFAFAPPRFVRLAQVHLATVQWIPFGLAFLHRYARGARRADLLVAAVLLHAPVAHQRPRGPVHGPGAAERSSSTSGPSGGCRVPRACWPISASPVRSSWPSTWSSSFPTCERKPTWGCTARSARSTTGTRTP